MRTTQLPALALALALTPALPLRAEAPPWTPLSLGACGVDRFADDHPEADGRGVVIAVLDTGVEMNAPGLRETPDGEVKVVDARDFSGEGDLRLSRAEPGPRKGTVVIRGSKGVAITVALPTGEGFAPASVLLGAVLDESAFQDSDAGDFDGDGRRESQFPILVFATEQDGERRYAAIFDSDGDGSLEGEPVLFDYGVRQDHIRMRRAGARDGGVTSLAVNIIPEERRISLHFDSGAHGTHVAGIAAGHELGGEPGFNGVAPGAKVISLKIGNGRGWRSPTSSGSMVRAFEYAAEYARTHDVPVIINVSYGLNAEKEGDSSIDRAVEQILRDNPRLVACISAGNEGPGLSTVGTPAAAPSALAIGAVLPRETMRDTRGTKLPHVAMATFSSRGGEVPKPDIVTPGVAASSVPAWVKGNDLYFGTSMAAPYASGLCARLASLALGEEGEAPTRDTIRRALVTSAALPEGTTPLDAGAGLPDLPKAGAALAALLPRQREDDPSAIDVATPSPMGAGSFPAAFVRGIAPPSEPQKFTLTAKFPSDTPREVTDGFHRRYFVASRSPWIKPVQESIYLRAGQSATVTLEYDAGAISQPGLHVGDVELREEGTPGDVAPEATLRTSVVIADRFDPAFEVRWPARRAEDSMRPSRHFLYVPPWAPSVSFALEAPSPRAYSVHVPSLFAHDGRAISARGLSLPKESTAIRAEWTWSSGIEPGVVELPVMERTGDQSGEYTLTARLGAVALTPASATAARAPQKGASFAFRATNMSERPITARASARLDSIRLVEEAEFGGEDGGDTWTHMAGVGPETRAVRVRVVFPEDAYASFTDVALEIEDGRGKRLAGSAMGTREEEFEATLPPGADQILVRVAPAYADEWSHPAATATVTIDRILRNPLEGKVQSGDSESILLYPGASVGVTAKFGGEAPDFASRAKLAGKLVLTNDDGGAPIIEAPLESGRPRD